MKIGKATQCQSRCTWMITESLRFPACLQMIQSRLTSYKIFRFATKLTDIITRLMTLRQEVPGQKPVATHTNSKVQLRADRSAHPTWEHIYCRALYRSP